METNERLTIPARRRAGLAIENTHKQYSKPGGLAELEDKLEQSREKCSQYIYGLARFAFADKAHTEPAQMFSDMCAYAEEQFKARHGVDNVKDVLPIWSVFKSNIKRGIRAGLNPTDHTTEWEFRKATQNTMVDEATGEPAKKETNNGMIRVPEVRTWLDRTSIDNRLKTLLAKLVVEVEYINKKSNTEAEEVLKEAVSALSKLVDLRRIKDEPTRNAMQKVA